MSLDMWKNINEQLEFLKIDSKRITKYVQKQFPINNHSKSHKINKPYTQMTLHFAKDTKPDTDFPDKNC